jgi:magnesium transporter
MTAPETRIGAPARTAGALATRRVPVVGPAERAGSALSGLRGQRFDTASMVAVCVEGDRLTGLVPLERLLAAPPETPVGDLVEPGLPMVTPDTDQERAAWLAARHGQSAVAVAERDGRFHGLVDARRLLEVLSEEHREDLARLGGYLRSGAGARAASLESVPRRLWHRLPWLGLGLAGALLSAGLMNAFERQLSAALLIAFFVPSILYLADAVGTQTETLVIRGISVGVGIRRIVRQEVLTGLAAGGLLGVAMLPVVAVVWGEVTVAAAVAVAVFAACTVSTLVAMALPWTLSRLGLDPAFGSGPLSTVVQDLLSIMIYLVVAAALVL